MDRNKLTLATVFAVVVLGLVTVTLFVNHQSDQDLVNPALDRLFAAESLSGGVAIDTFINPEQFVADAGWGSLDLPLRISGPVELRSAAGGRSLAGQSRLDFRFGGAGADPLLTVDLRSVGGGRNFVRLQGLPDEETTGLSLRELNGSWFELGGSETELLLPWLNRSGDGSEEDIPLADSSGRLWLVPLQRLSDTMMDGRSVLHYELSVEPIGLTNFLSRLMGGLLGRDLSVSERQSLAGWVRERDLVAEGYLDRKTGLFRAIKLGFFPREGQEGQALALTLTIDSLNEPLSVNVPEEAEPFSSSLQQLLSGVAGRPAE